MTGDDDRVEESQASNASRGTWATWKAPLTERMIQSPGRATASPLGVPTWTAPGSSNA